MERERTSIFDFVGNLRADSHRHVEGVNSKHHIFKTPDVLDEGVNG
jgi:hypothetical protein